MKCPQYAKVGDRQYKINTSFRTAIKCQEIATDKTIGDYERSLGIICTLFGTEALDNSEDYEKLLELAKKYLSCGKEIQETNKKPDMGYIKDMDLIEASFMSDYHIDLTQEDMDWWKFNNLINGLSNSELGNCCILNNIRNLRRFDASKIKDTAEKQKILEAQRFWALDNEEEQEVHLTKEQQKSVDEFYKSLGF